MTNSEDRFDVKPEVISIRHMWAGYEHDSVLEDINLSVKALDFIGLIGPNGGGKTTLIRVLLGLLQPTHGEVRIMGKSVKVGRKHIGYVPQILQFDLEFPISVWDVVRMGRLGTSHLLKPFSSHDNEVVEATLNSVDMLPLRHRAVGELSGGQRQRVLIARALVTEPDILILDEPTSSVDASTQANIYDILQRLNERVTILMISHDIGVISSYVKTIGCLNRRLFYHEGRQITPDMMEKAYHCPVDLIAHGVPHRVFPDHAAEVES